MANGKGVFYYEDGNKYEGNFKNDKASGYGILTDNNGTVYEGEWLEDMQHG